MWHVIRIRNKADALGSLFQYVASISMFCFSLPKHFIKNIVFIIYACTISKLDTGETRASSKLFSPFSHGESSKIHPDYFHPTKTGATSFAGPSSGHGCLGSHISHVILSTEEARGYKPCWKFGYHWFACCLLPSGIPVLCNFIDSSGKGQDELVLVVWIESIAGLYMTIWVTFHCITIEW